MDPTGPDAVYIMGRDNSAFFLEGSREDVKNWTSRGLHYVDRPLGISSRVWQRATRIGSLLLLLFTFLVIPNGSTMDQLAFILLNGLAQLNVIVGSRVHHDKCLARLKIVEEGEVLTRTHVYAKLLIRFKNAGHTIDWVAESGVLPKIVIWDEWKDKVIDDNLQIDAKDLY